MTVVAATSSTNFHYGNSIDPANDGAVMPAGLVTGDYLLAVVVWRGAGAGLATVTSTDGFTLLDTLFGGDSTITLWLKPYSAGLGLQWNSSASDWCANQIIGLHNVSGSYTFLQSTPFSGSQFNPPHTFTFTGGTAASGDDLVVLGGLDPSNSDTWTYLNGTSSAGTWTNVAGVPNGQGAQSILQYLAGVSAGATGTMSATGTGTPLFIQTDYAGWMIAMTQAGGGGGGGGINVGGITYVTS